MTTELHTHSTQTYPNDKGAGKDAKKHIRDLERNEIVRCPTAKVCFEVTRASHHPADIDSSEYGLHVRHKGQFHKYFYRFGDTQDIPHTDTNHNHSRQYNLITAVGFSLKYRYGTSSADDYKRCESEYRDPPSYTRKGWEIRPHNLTNWAVFIDR